MVSCRLSFQFCLELEFVDKNRQQRSAVDIYGFLGVLNICQTHYLVVITECEEVCRVDTSLAK